MATAKKPAKKSTTKPRAKARVRVRKRLNAASPKAEPTTMTESKMVDGDNNPFSVDDYQRSWKATPYWIRATVIVLAVALVVAILF